MTEGCDSGGSSVPGMDGAIDHKAAARLARARFCDHAARLESPSLAWGVVHDGEVIDGEAVDAVYRIASMTKSFTAAAVLMLRDEGRLRLDDAIADVAPSLAGVGHPDPTAPAITVRHLLSMSSGLPTDDAWADRNLDMTDADLDAIVATGPRFAAIPGTAFVYSNLGFALLGRVVLEVTGERVQSLITSRLLDPLGMTRTTWTAPPDAVPGYGEGSDDPVTEPFLGDGVMAPMGGLFTTVSELAIWVDFLSTAFRSDVDAGRAGRYDAILSPTSRREMQQVWTVDLAVPDVAGGWKSSPGGYGLGLRVQPHTRLGAVVAHSGGLPGFGSNMRWVRSTGAGLVALSNTTYAPMATVTTDVLDVLAEAGAFTADSPAASGELADAGARLVALLNSWSDEAADALFSDNVAVDSPYAARRSAAERFVAEHGPLVLARVIGETATTATAILHTRSHEAHLEYELWPGRTARVQLYDLSLAP